jgi:hypothetical protein
MDRLTGTQLSLIADEESPYQYPDWAIDASPPPARSTDGGQTKNRPLDSALHDGGQPETRILPMEGNGGQNKNPPPDPPSSMFTRSRGDDGTWIEKQTRKSGVFEYLRWRDFDGKKRAKYLGKVSLLQP